MIALIEYGQYSDYTVDVIEVDEPWQVWAYCLIRDQESYDGREVTSIIDGHRIYPSGPSGVKDNSWLTDLMQWGRMSRINPMREDAEFDLASVFEVESRTMEGCPARDCYIVTPETAAAAMQRAREHIEAKCAAEGKPVPWLFVKQGGKL